MCVVSLESKGKKPTLGACFWRTSLTQNNLWLAGFFFFPISFPCHFLWQNVFGGQTTSLGILLGQKSWSVWPPCHHPSCRRNHIMTLKLWTQGDLELAVRELYFSLCYFCACSVCGRPSLARTIASWCNEGVNCSHLLYLMGMFAASYY